MSKEPPDAMVKLYLVGDSTVGKTCLMLKYTSGKFSYDFITTIGIDFQAKTIEIGDKRVKIQIWDTAGQERFRTIATSYFRGAQGILLVYDITSKRSFDSVAEWMGEISTHAVEDVVVILVGNKSDLESERVVSYGNGEALARHYDIPFYETSAKNGANLAEIFLFAATTVLNRPKLQVKKETNINLEETDEPKRKGGCC